MSFDVSATRSRRVRPILWAALVGCVCLLAVSRPGVRVGYLMWQLRWDNVTHEEDPSSPWEATTHPYWRSSETMKKLVAYGWRALPAIIRGLEDDGIAAACYCMIGDIYIKENSLTALPDYLAEKPSTRHRRISDYDPFWSLTHAPDSRLRHIALNLLYGFEDPLSSHRLEAVAAMARRDSCPGVRATALLILRDQCYHGLADTVSASLLSGQPAEVRRTAIKVATALPQAASVALWKAHLSDDDPLVSVSAAERLSKETRDAATVEKILEFLEADDSDVRLYASHAVVRATRVCPIVSMLLRPSSEACTVESWASWWRSATNEQRDAEHKAWEELWTASGREVRAKALTAWREWWDSEGKHTFAEVSSAMEKPRQ